MDIASGNNHFAELVRYMNYLSVNIFKILNRLKALITLVLTAKHKSVVAIGLNFKIVIE